MNPDGPILFNIACALIASAASIIAYFVKRNFHELDKKQDAQDAEMKLLVERMHQMALAQAKHEAIVNSVNEIKTDLRELRTDFSRYIRGSIHD